jgi:homeobox protein cut-like
VEEKEVSQLVEDVQRLTRQSAEAEAKQAARAAALEAKLATTVGQVAGLEERLARQQDYETVKKELAILRALEFSSSQEEEDANRPLEVLILERSKVRFTISAACCNMITPKIH